LCIALDRAQLARNSHTEHRLASVAILDDRLYEDWIADGLCPPNGDVSNVPEAQSEIANGNYWIEDGWLRTGDDSYKPSLLVTAERQDLVAHARLMQRQWQKNLNLEVEVNALPRHQAQAERAKGNFDILYDAVWANQGALATYDSLFGAHWLRPIGEAASGNFGRWRDDQFESLLKMALAKDEHANSYDLCHQMQRVIAHELPVYAIHLSDLSFVISQRRWAGWPRPMTSTFIPSFILGPDAALTMKNLRPA
jgi:peptide/nickel transport system substrate-binding protein